MALTAMLVVAHVGAHAHRIRPAAQWSEYSDTPAGFVYLKLAIAQVTAVNVIGHIPIPRVTQKRVVIEDFVFQLVR
jgi:hypothetical protein